MNQKKEKETIDPHLEEASKEFDEALKDLARFWELFKELLLKTWNIFEKICLNLIGLCLFFARTYNRITRYFRREK